jgi:enamine deaminase RidA (YjgF/YER057c/UK114 family)
MLEHIDPPGSTIPGISQAVRVRGGQLVFLSGHVPYTPSGTLPESFPEQVEQVFANLGSTLAAAGCTFEDVARLTVYILEYEPAMLAVFRSVRDRFITGKSPPASALIGVSALFQPGVLVEIDAIAVAPEVS